MKRSKKLLLSAAAIVVVLAVAAIVFAGANKVAPVGWRAFGEVNVDGDLALGGYDAVAYQVDGAAVEGDHSLIHRHAGVTYRFASEASRQAFVADPARYAPQLGGFCAFAVSKGFTADIDPTAFHVEDERLYVFADAGVRDEWIAARDEGVVAETEELWSQR